MQYCVWFKDLDKGSLGVAGGKGANLGEMFSIGLPVPDGFAVSAQTYARFLEVSGLTEKLHSLLENLDVENTAQLQERSKQIQELITSTPMPEDMQESIAENYELLGADPRKAEQLISSQDVFVAVRSSATAEDLPDASFAGQQATFLNVRGREDVISAVRSCWASLFTARAMYYREKNGFDHTKVLISAIVQRMVNSDKSGIMFTVNPATNNKDEIVIEAVYGLGETIVGGQVNPDFYLVDKHSREIKTIEVKKQTWGLFRAEDGSNEKRDVVERDQERQVIHEKHIKELARLGKKIEDHYHKPQDIEWAVEGENVFIVQARAVTTFTEENEAEEKISGTVLISGETASRGHHTGKVKIVGDPSELSKIEKGDIMVTRMTTPDMVPAMQRAGAIVTDEGGMTCHAAIVSREMGTPCIVGTQNATSVLKEGTIVTVAATQGEVYEGEVGVEEKEQEVLSAKGIATTVKVKAIVDLPEKAQHAVDLGADGAGLVRLEIMIAKGGIHPAEYVRSGRVDDYVALLKKGIGTIAKAFGDKPVWIRCSDMRSDEYRQLEGGDKEPQESDPMIGWHAIRRLLDEPEILRAEFRALKELHEEGVTNVGVMIPFVIRVEELHRAKEILREVGLEPSKDIAFGVMVETPAVCWIMEEVCKEGVDFVSFGTNDLTQLTLGIDRNNGRIAPLFDEMHPAVLGQIAQVLEVCSRYDVEASICGQAGSRPDMARFLVERGIGSISANSDALGEIRRTVADVEKEVTKQ